MIYGYVLLFQVCDIASGIISTKIKKKKLKSSVMATGLFKKTASILLIFVFHMLAYFSKEYLNFEISLHLPIAVYVISMELISISENLSNCGVNTTPLKDVANKMRGVSENGNNESK